jgi:hypothetical protein
MRQEYLGLYLVVVLGFVSMVTQSHAQSISYAHSIQRASDTTYLASNVTQRDTETANEIGASRRPRPELKFDWAPSQVTATYRYTLDDYSFLTSTGVIERTRLNGGALEFAWHRLYPWEVVGTVAYSRGNPLGQTLGTVAVGVGYTRVFARLMPYARLQLGASRTSSTDFMYLSPGPRWGLTTVESVGLDYRVSPHFGIRPIHLQNEYLPFGSHGSVYWSAGTGITYNIRP